jgi:thiol-disulfide isomerase/thioredoxin
MSGLSHSFAAAAIALGVGASALAAQNVKLEHVGRYNHQLVGRDHLVGTLPIREHYAVTCSFDALRVIDLAALPAGQGTSTFISELRGHDVYSLVNYDDEFIFANLRLGGFGVVRIYPVTMAIQWIKTVEEDGVYYEDMDVVGNRLYVAAHAYGLRVFDVTQPQQPVLVGSLSEGFTDAFAVDVSGRNAYVADGAGGLKVVDISNPAAMQIIAGESVGMSAIGTAEDVLVIGKDVYVAAGSDGILTYEDGDLTKRKQFQTPGIARALAKIGEFLAVADISGITLMETSSRAMLATVASERGLRRLLPSSDLTLRLWHGASPWGSDRVVAANWDSVDVYKIVPAALATQRDATLSDQRLRFPIVGGSKEVKLSSTGATALQVTSITSSAPAAFSVSPSGPLTIPSGASIPITITYSPGGPSQAIIKVASNDPDEGTLPIEVFGNTQFPDPGDLAPQFTLPMWTYDHDRKIFSQSSFSLADQEGKLVYIQVFGTWCPACLPVIADLQNALAAPFEGHPQVIVTMMSQKESAALLQEYWSNVYLRAPMLFDLSGSTSFIAYAQPPSGLPFSRGFLIGPDRVIEETWFGFNADRVKDAIYHQLLRIRIPGDANLDGQVDRDDCQAVVDAWGLCPDPSFCPADQNGDGFVDGVDYAIVCRHFGTVAP